MTYPDVKTRYELKNNAKNILRGNWPRAIGGVLFYYLVSLGISFIIGKLGIDKPYNYIIEVLVSVFLVYPLSFGFYKFFLKFRENAGNDMMMFFDPFKYFYKNSVAISAIYIGAFIIGSVIFVIPVAFYFIGMTITAAVALCIAGVAYIAYCLYISALVFVATFILVESPEMNVSEIIKKAYDYMNNNWLDYIVLQLSFLGWLLVGIIPCGIGLLWVVPYLTVTDSLYFESLRDHYEGVEDFVEIDENNEKTQDDDIIL